MQFSNDNTHWSAPEPYTRKKTWILSPGDGEKAVYVKFKDSNDNWSDAFSGTIVLRTPTLTQNRSFPVDFNISGLAYSGGKLFALNKFYDLSTQSDKANIYALDPANGSILNSFSVPPDVSDLTSDGVNLYVNMREPLGNILKLDPTNGSILATVHSSGIAGIMGYVEGLALLNSDIFQVANTENCGRGSIMRMNSEDGSFLGCFNTDSFGNHGRELDSDGTNLLYGTWFRDTVYRGTYFWTVSTLSPSGSLLKSDTILLGRTSDAPYVFEAWGNKQLFVADRGSKQIHVFLLPSTIGVFPTSMNLGQLSVGSTSVPQTATISNPGPVNLVISSIGITGANAGMFKAAAGGPKPCSSLTPTIAPGENCTIDVTFTPTSLFDKNATLRISSIGLEENPVGAFRGTLRRLVHRTFTWGNIRDTSEWH